MIKSLFIFLYLTSISLYGIDNHILDNFKSYKDFYTNKTKNHLAYLEHNNILSSENILFKKIFNNIELNHKEINKINKEMSENGEFDILDHNKKLVKTIKPYIFNYNYLNPDISYLEIKNNNNYYIELKNIKNYYYVKNKRKEIDPFTIIEKYLNAYMFKIYTNDFKQPVVLFFPNMEKLLKFKKIFNKIYSDYLNSYYYYHKYTKNKQLYPYIDKIYMSSEKNIYFDFKLNKFNNENIKTKYVKEIDISNEIHNSKKIEYFIYDFNENKILTKTNKYIKVNFNLEDISNNGKTENRIYKFFNIMKTNKNDEIEIEFLKDKYNKNLYSIFTSDNKLIGIKFQLKGLSKLKYKNLLFYQKVSINNISYRYVKIIDNYIYLLPNNHEDILNTLKNISNI